MYIILKIQSLWRGRVTNISTFVSFPTNNFILFWVVPRSQLRFPGRYYIPTYKKKYPLVRPYNAFRQISAI